jgi:ribonucrease Y
MSLFSRLTQVFRKGGAPVSPARPSGQAKPKPVKPGFKLESRPVKPLPSAPVATVVPDTLVREAQAKAKEIVLEAKDEALRLREQAETKHREVQQRINQMQNQVSQKEHQLDRQEAVLAEKERLLSRLEQDVTVQRTTIENLKKQLVEKLEDVAGMTRDEAKDALLKAVERRSVKDIAIRIKQAEEKARLEADEKAQEILLDSMKHGATDYIAEYAVSSIELPGEDVKGRLIGKEGRNIRAFERATGVDLDLDEAGTVRLSSFDSVRREIARQALKRLITDGRIQPARIEEYVERAKKDIEKVMFEEGKKLCHAVGAYSVPHDLIQMLGRFKYRSSYGQNMIAHTLEETKIGIALAHELKADVETVRLGCLLHDIGKVVTDEEGSHVDLGVKLLKKYNISEKVIDAVAQHHEDTQFTSKEAVVVYIADAISGARPGARYENYDEYVKRLDNLEKIALDFKGISDAYAIQAGRELRVMVDSHTISDDESIVVAEKIRDRIKNEMTYPGTVTVNVIRETRSQAVAT